MILLLLHLVSVQFTFDASEKIASGDMRGSLGFLNSGEYYHFESPTPPLPQETLSKSSDTGENPVNAIASSPVQCFSSMALQ